MKSRTIRTQYQDPLDLIWSSAAEKLGFRIARSTAVFASFDGRSTLTISGDSEFDADDNLAQMVFHELCHALVAGPDGRRLPDWGLENTDNRDVISEYATNRLQAFLSARHGLRAFFATTTDFRLYYDALPQDPLAPCVDALDPQNKAVALTRRALADADQEPWNTVLNDALRRTAIIAAAVAGVAPAHSLWSAGATE